MGDVGSAEPPLSVVVASVNGLPYLADCLAALVEHAPSAEVIVADSTNAETRALVAERFPRVKLLSFDEPGLHAQFDDALEEVLEGLNPVATADLGEAAVVGQQLVQVVAQVPVVR